MSNGIPFFPVPIRTARVGSEYWSLHPNGCIERNHPMNGLHWGPSPKWRIVGAVKINNSGSEGERYPLARVLTEPKSIRWLGVRGAQKVHLLDFDHGAYRMLGTPVHEVF